MPSFILIHPTVWLQYTNVTDRTDRQTDNGPIAQGEPFYKRSPKNTLKNTRMWADAQRDGRPAEYRGALCSTPKSLADAHYSSAVQ